MHPRVDHAGQALCWRHVARFERLLPEYVSRIGWSWDQVRTERLRVLRELLSVAVQRSPWHRERLAGLDAGHVSEGNVGSLPVMTNADLMDNFDDITTDRRTSRGLCEAHLEGGAGPGYLLGDYSGVASGGSSGQRGVFVYGWEAWAICYASIVRFQQRDRALDPSLAAMERVTAVVAASSATHLSAAISRTFSTPRSPRQLFPVSQPMETIVAGSTTCSPPS